uniref:GpH n=1 Tax=uncultured Spirochaetaceae bacterium TaxID=201186 RepID=A0A650ENI7_9SPIO|nr:gpH [uncultured Spirochaetaceae bacterium]
MGRLTDFFLGLKKEPEEESEKKSERQILKTEQAFAVPYTNRRAWSDFSILESLNPERLARILRDVRQGECPAEYLELAQDMETKDLHYRSVISTRKDAVCGLDIKVTPASEDKRDIEIADAVRENIIGNTCANLTRLIRDMMDGLAKGFSVNEIMWDTRGKIWKPERYEWRDARWFQYDKDTGKTLMLRDPLTDELRPLPPNKFIIHEPHLISGNQIIAGLAMPALFYLMLKSYDVTSWAAFIDRYGFPIRLGKYGRKATEQDIKTLKKAVAAIGTDFGAVIPESAVIEIVESSRASENSDAYKNMATWVDKQISKLVLGQTMTVDEGSSRAQSQTHEEIRDDIADADIRQLNATLNAQLVTPFVKFNFGEQEAYPKLEIYKPDSHSVEQIVNAVDVLGRQGLKVKADEIRTLLGLTKPEDGDEVIGGIYEGQATGGAADDFGEEEKESGRKTKDLNARQNTSAEETPTSELEEETVDGYVEISDEIAAVLEKAADRATDFDSFKKELEKLAVEWNPDKIAELMAAAFFAARAKGDIKFAEE